MDMVIKQQTLVIVCFVYFLNVCAVSLPNETSSLPIDEIIPSVFSVIAEEETGQHHRGTAFAIHPKGIFVTCAHVLKTCQRGRLDDLHGRVFPFRVLGIDPETDIAFLQAETSETFRALPVRFGYKPSWNEPVFSVQYLAAVNQGRFINRGFIVSQGHVASPDAVFHNILHSDMPNDGGGSGAAVYNAKGECIGIIFGRTHDHTGAKYTHIIQADYLFIAFRKTMMLRQVYGLGTGINQTKDDDSGLLIEGIDIPSAAQKAGIEKGDQILSIDGTPVRNNFDLWVANLVWGLGNHGKPMPVELKKGSDQTTKTVLLAHERDVFTPVSREPENLKPGCLVAVHFDPDNAFDKEIVFSGQMQSLDVMPFPAKHSIEIKGYLRIPQEGSYTFCLSLPGKGALMIGEKFAFNKSNDHEKMSSIHRGYFEEGLYLFRLQFVPAETAEAPFLTYQFFDNGDFSPFQPIPKDWLFY